QTLALKNDRPVVKRSMIRLRLSPPKFFEAEKRIAPMYHRTRWTPEKIKQRLELIAPLVYCRRSPLSPYRYLHLDDPLVVPPVGTNVDDSPWQEIRANQFWGTRNLHFIRRTTFQLAREWHKSQP